MKIAVRVTDVTADGRCGDPNSDLAGGQRTADPRLVTQCVWTVDDALGPVEIKSGVGWGVAGWSGNPTSNLNRPRTGR